MQSLKIILVGNGPSLLEREMGNEIDEYDIVIRFNKYKTEGYEVQVGQKIDIWCLDTQHFKELFNKKKLREPKEIWVLPSARYEDNTEKIVNRLQSSKYKFFVGTRKFASELQGIIEGFPTTGINAIQTAINRFKQRIDLIGFDGTTKNYFPEKKDLRGHPHEMSRETTHINRLTKQGWTRRI